jgi:26S proteasome regulatory subunit N1
MIVQMSMRTFDHLLHYGELPVKRVVPLALALLYVSNPDYSVIDQLSRLSHDQVAAAALSITLLLLVSPLSSRSRQCIRMINDLSPSHFLSFYSLSRLRTLSCHRERYWV